MIIFYISVCRNRSTSYQTHYRLLNGLYGRGSRLCYAFVGQIQIDSCSSQCNLNFSKTQMNKNKLCCQCLGSPRDDTISVHLKYFHQALLVPKVNFNCRNRNSKFCSTSLPSILETRIFSFIDCIYEYRMLRLYCKNRT